MGSNYKINYDIDIAFCIDATGSMGDFIEKAQNGVMNVYQNVIKDMASRGRHVENFRVRIIAFRDYFYDGRDAMRVTDFFRLPQEANMLKKCLSSLVANGGGDDPEDGLEALAYAIRSKWNNKGVWKRHVIILMTDADTHDLGFGKDSDYHPKGMAADMNELTSWWGDIEEQGYMNQHAKRFILVAPDTPGWRKVSDYWDKVIHIPITEGSGLYDSQYSQILTAIFELL